MSRGPDGMVPLTPVPRARLTAGAARTSPHLKPICKAVADYGCRFAVVAQRSGRFRFPASEGPMITLIADDLDAALGPDGFHRKSLRRLIREAGCAVIVSSGPEERVYQTAAATAVVMRQPVVLIETRIEQELPWLDFVQKTKPGLPTLVSTVKSGRA